MPMNTEPESEGPNTPNLPPAPEAIGAPHSNCRRNGNVARLPKAVRDQINAMIQDGVPYAAVIERLGEAGKGLGISNLSRWKDGGYRDWLLEQNWLADIRARQESASDLTG